ncbi:hypothetical protein ACROYT_G036621 [Oculina patagonica]
MSSANVLPSAPAYGDREENSVKQTLYPALPNQPENFRLTKINQICSEFDKEVAKYRAVLKKYKKVKSFFHYSAISMGGLSSVLSASSLGTAVTVVGLPVSVPLAACAAITGVLSAAFTGASKKLEPKIIKNNEITSLAVAKRETVNRLVSAALIDNKVDDKEFQIILDEYSRYMALKETVRMHLTKNLSQKKSSPQPDIEKLRQEIRQEELDRLKKRISAESKSDLRK